MEGPSTLRGESLKRLLPGVVLGFVLGIALTIAVGFNWFYYGFNWTLGGTAEKMALYRVEIALVAAYTPLCVEKFVGTADDAKWQEFAKIEPWRREDFVEKAGFATIAGDTEPNSSVAIACAGVLTKLLETRAPKN
jgi:hypothetical protein